MRGLPGIFSLIVLTACEAIPPGATGVAESSHVLAEQGDTARLLRAIAADGDVDKVEITHGWTALIWAAERGHLATVRSLLALGADRSVRDDRGWSARDWADREGHIAVVALL